MDSYYPILPRRRIERRRATVTISLINIIGYAVCRICGISLAVYTIKRSKCERRR
jgi:hypothetical protein